MVGLARRREPRALSWNGGLGRTVDHEKQPAEMIGIRQVKEI